VFQFRKVGEVVVRAARNWRWFGFRGERWWNCIFRFFHFERKKTWRSCLSVVVV